MTFLRQLISWLLRTVRQPQLQPQLQPQVQQHNTRFLQRAEARVYRYYKHHYAGVGTTPRHILEKAAFIEHTRGKEHLRQLLTRAAAHGSLQ